MGGEGRGGEGRGGGGGGERMKGCFSLLAAQFVVHVRGENLVALQNVNDPSRWIKIQGDEIKGDVSTFDIPYY